MRCVAAALVAALFPTLLSPAQGPPHDVDALYVAIANRPEPPRERANWLALHVAGCDRPLDVLEAILRHRAWLPEESGYGLFGVRETAAHALHSIDPERAATLLFDHEPLVIEAVAGAIVGYEPPSWQPYDRWRRPRPRFRATTLSEKPSRRQCLETLLCDDAHARREALAVLCMMPGLSPAGLPRDLVVRARRQLDRLPAMVALGADWRVALEDPDPRVRRYAILRWTRRIPRWTWAMHARRKPLPPDDFARAIKDPDRQVRFAAIRECRRTQPLIDVATAGSPLDRIAAMLAIADVPYLYRDQPSRLMPAVVNGLRDDSPVVRRAALRLAAKIGRAAGPFVPAIVRLALSDRTPNRAEAAAALGAIGGPVAVTTLIHLLHDPDIGVVDRAVRAIAAIGPDAHPAVEALLGLGTVYLGPIRVRRYWSTAGCGTGRMRPPHPVPHTLVEHAIKQIGAPAVLALVEALDDPVDIRDRPAPHPAPEPTVLFPDPPPPAHLPVPMPHVRPPAPAHHRILRLLQLLQSEGRAAGDRVARLLDDTDAKTRDLAAETLVQIDEGRRIVSHLLRELLRDPWAIECSPGAGRISWQTRHIHPVVVRLARVDPEELLPALHHDHPAIRYEAAWGVVSKRAGTFDGFLAALSADEPRQHLGAVAAAMRGVVRCRNESDRERLRALTRFDDPVVRWGAVAALKWNLGEARRARDVRRSIVAIRARFADPDPRVQLAAIEAFPLLGHPDDVAIALDAFEPVSAHAPDAVVANVAVRIAELPSTVRRDRLLLRLLRERPLPTVIRAATVATRSATRDLSIQLAAAAVALQASDDAVVAMLAERLARAIVPQR